MGVYEYDALGTLKACGVTHLELWCVTLPCYHWGRVAIDDLILRHGPATRLMMIARLSRCQTCKRRGAHVQPSREDRGTPGSPARKLASFAWALKAS